MSCDEIDQNIVFVCLQSPNVSLFSEIGFSLWDSNLNRISRMVPEYINTHNVSQVLLSCLYIFLYIISYKCLTLNSVCECEQVK